MSSWPPKLGALRHSWIDTTTSAGGSAAVMRSAFTCASHDAGLGRTGRVVIPIHQDSDALRVAAKQSPLVSALVSTANAPFVSMPFDGCPPGHVPRIRSFRRTGYGPTARNTYPTPRSCPNAADQIGHRQTGRNGQTGHRHPNSPLSTFVRPELEITQRLPRLYPMP
jgi:hypothetical protein